MIPVKGYAAQSPTTDLASWDFQRREVGPHDVQFDILFCGVCHSDLHQIKNDWFPGIFPMVPGHEIVGKVVKVGNHVKKFKVGDLSPAQVAWLTPVANAKIASVTWSNIVSRVVPKPIMVSSRTKRRQPTAVIPRLL
jgi:D-arabinose 1-dehydrogenase-like Zn-dependent alcohol dehydrogenase